MSSETTIPDPRDPVRMGTPITTAEAVRAILRELKSPVIGDIDLDSLGRSLERLGREGTIYHVLSSGEQRLVDAATALWQAPMNDDPILLALGGLDPDRRRRLLVILFYRYLGRDLDVEVDGNVFADMFADR